MLGVDTKVSKFEKKKIDHEEKLKRIKEKQQSTIERYTTTGITF